MAGISAARSRTSAIIVESNTVAGRKLLRTGRGRCNLTHTGSIDEFVRAYGDSGRFLKHSLYEFSPDGTRDFFTDNGLATEAKKDGCVFPITNRAADVKRILVDIARRLNVQFMYGRKVTAIHKQPNGFLVETAAENIDCSAVIIATGGVSWPFTGSTGDGYRFAAELGHKIITPKPALVPLVTKEQWPGSLQGVGIAKVRLSAVVDKKQVSSAGPLMFTSNGIGGPASQDFSREIAYTLTEPGQSIEVHLDLMPDMDIPELTNFIIDECGKHPRKELAGVLTGFLPRAISIFICSRLKPAGQILVSQFSKAARAELVEMMKALPLTIVTTQPIEEATVTRGGVATDQIDSKTMRSKLHAGLFFAGEVIDVDGPCGGYNLQIAWSTGTLAGRSAANHIKQNKD